MLYREISVFPHSPYLDEFVVFINNFRRTMTHLSKGLQVGGWGETEQK